MADLIFHWCDIALFPPVHRGREVLTPKVNRPGIDSCDVPLQSLVQLTELH